MPICYTLPGLGGSTLGTSPATPDDTWVSYTALARGLLGRLRLGPDGLSPGPPDGVQLYVGYPLPDYYAGPNLALQVALQPSGYTVIPVPYDWRLDPSFAGESLAARIRAQIPITDPCSIVGHSLGGVVARLAWRSLVRSGDSLLVRRIVTLGTPHWGSYGPVRIWSLDSELATQLYYLSLASIIIDYPTSAYLFGHVWTARRVSILASTWPALYWTLPSMLGPDAALDIGRGAIYQGQWPADRGVSSPQLTAALTVYQPALAAAESLPPPWVLTTVGGEGFPTVAQLARPQLLGSTGAYEGTGDGDGQVHLASALLPGSAQYQLSGAHGDLPVITAGFAAAAQVILEDRHNPAPPPPLVQVPGVNEFRLHGPPSPTLLEGMPDC